MARMPGSKSDPDLANVETERMTVRIEPRLKKRLESMSYHQKHTLTRVVVRLIKLGLKADRKSKTTEEAKAGGR